MLKELKIENLAIIEKLDLEFKEGFIVLTGETGAGKSIIMNAINLLIGEKGSIDMIRDGEETLLAQGIFEVNKDQSEELANLGIENIEDNEVIIRRYLDRSGKGKAFVNNIRVPLGSLKEIMSTLVDIVGQHSHQMLLSKSNHIKLLDKFLEDKGKTVKANVSTLYSEYNKINFEILELANEKKDFEEKKDFYEYQLSEINLLDLREEEDILLELEYKKLFNASKIKEKLQNAIILLREGDSNALSNLNTTRKSLDMLVKYGDEFNEILERIEKVYYELEDTVDSLLTINRNIEVNDNKLEKIIMRLESINKLKLKYGSTIKEILEYRDKIEEKLKNLEEVGMELKYLLEKKVKKETEYFEKAKILTDIRKERSKEIEDHLKVQMEFLNMKNIEFKIAFENLEVVSPNGADKIEFLISTNLGQSIKPLSKIASGGEVSRIMLALKVIFSKVDNISMLLFDEIDSGVGGETVKKIGEKLREIGSKSQVICITHSPPIAARANQQFYIEKQIKNGETFSSVKNLTFEERVGEIGRMLAGENPTESVLAHARELLNGN
jgi:DNA repair protein RecN (Recombination protein N)